MVWEKNTGKKYENKIRGTNYEKKVRGGNTGNKLRKTKYGGKIREKSGTFCTTITKKKVWEKKVRGKKVRGKKYGEKSMGKKSTGKNIKAEQGLFRSRDFVTSGEKGPTRADIAQLSVAHAQNILPNMASSVTSGQTCARHHCRLLTLIALPQM